MPTPPPILLYEYRGYQLYIPRGGGKAGAGRNRTSNVQVRKDSCIRKQFKFVVEDPDGYFAAAQKAEAWIDERSRVIPVTPSQAQELYNRGWDCHPTVPEPSK